MPQIVDEAPLNPMGCWDFWGYTGDFFATNKGTQTSAIKAMVDRVMGSQLLIMLI
jgi:hypothetical protein